MQFFSIGGIYFFNSHSGLGSIFGYFVFYSCTTADQNVDPEYYD
jgi:hypothetical protein